jgi:hypothetical protein
MRDAGDHYEYVVGYVDALIVDALHTLLLDLTSGASGFRSCSWQLQFGGKCLFVNKVGRRYSAEEVRWVNPQRCRTKLTAYRRSLP